MRGKDLGVMIIKYSQKFKKWTLTDEQKWWHLDVKKVALKWKVDHKEQLAFL